jgi:PAS domain S-box-containing protein
MSAEATRTPLEQQVRALRRLALAATQPAGPHLFQDLVDEVARALEVEVALVAILADADCTRMRTLAAVMGGRPAPPVEYALAESPCVEVVGKGYCFMARGVAARFKADAMVAKLGLDAYAAFPMNDSRGQPLGLVAALDPRSIAGGDADHAEAVLKIAAVRLGAELERAAADESLRRSEASYRAIFEAAADALAVRDADFRVVDVNAAYEALTGRRRDEVIGQIGQTITDDPSVDRLALHARALAGEPVRIETTGRRPDGTPILLEVRGVPMNYLGKPHVLYMGRDITSRKAAEGALRASEEQYRAIFNATADALVLRDAAFRIVDVNAAYETVSGTRREEVIGLTDLTLTRHARVIDRRALHEQALAGRPVFFEADGRRQNGSPFVLEVRGLPMSYRGEPHVLYIGRDVTDAKLAERALRASWEQYRAIFNAWADAVVLRAADFSIVDVNATYEAMSGYRLDEVLGVDRVLANPPEVGPMIRALHERALAGEPIALDTVLVRRDGQRYDLELRGVPIQHRGQPHVLYIGRDITQRKQAETALRASEEQYRAIFNASADALMLWDRHLRRIDVNPAHQRIFGYAREDVVGRGFEGLDYPQDMVRQREEMLRRALDGEAQQVEVEAMRKDGQRIVTELRTVPFQHRDEPHVLQIARDITAQRAAQAERAALESQLRQAQKMEAIGQLTGGIAHDFNNILTSVIGYLVLAQERAERIDDASLVRQLGSAHTAAQRARDLIAQMLAFARRQRGDRRVIALPPVVRQGLQLLRSTLPTSIVLDDSGLDNSVSLPPVRADAVQIEQVLFNLCINARDAMQRNGRIAVRVHEHQGGPLRCASCGSAVGASRWLRLSVSDTGSGIDPAVVSRMFEPFFTTKDIGRGSGMGLAMVHGIVHEHDGHIVVETAPGRGTSFHVLLPVAKGAAEAAVTGVSAAVGGAPMSGRVMVVEDEPMVAAFMRELLEGWGLEVVVPPDALAAARWFDDPDHEVDLLITDLTMPQLNGLELAHHVSVLRPALPVLLYSGDADTIDEEGLRRAGVRAVVAKPVDPPSLRLTLRRWLSETA